MRDLELEKYLEKVKDILTSKELCHMRTLQGPSQLLDYLYIGNMDEAHRIPLLKALGITHVLNCAAKRDYSTEDFDQNPYSKHAISYEEIEARDNDGYPLLRLHFTKCRKFIDQAKREGGRVLVHCQMGINRSGAICAAYMMLDQEMTLTQTLRLIKMERSTLICNEGFQRQLIEFARDHDLLYRT